MTNYEMTSYFGRLYPETTRAIIMIHGRGGDGIDFVNSLESELPLTKLFIVAPNAENNTWYPYSFLAPQSRNEPQLSASLSLIGELFNDLIETGYKREDIYLIGFSQGACLALEFAARIQPPECAQRGQVPEYRDLLWCRCQRSAFMQG